LTETIDLGLNVLDHQLLDAEGRRCGKVDDIALEGGPGEDLEVAAILCGAGVWRARAGWIGRVAAWLGGGGRVRIPWSDVAEVGSHVKLRRRAEELGLGRGDDRLRPYIEKIPGSDH
jgi:sporulation protein YlmC with PRC-barrel domain